MAERVSMSLVGTERLKAALTQAGPLAIEALTAAMAQEQQQVIAAAQRLTPVDSGALRASGTVLPPKVEGTVIEVTAGFGGAAAAYAIPVHERLGVHHPSGQAKFLEQPALERLPSMPARIAARVAKALERLGR